MLTLDEIRKKLFDRRLSVIAKSIGVRHGTLIDLREGRTANPSYETVRRLAEYFGEG